jgi:hypothetical protein
MGGKGMLTLKGFPTVITFVRLLPCVDHLMYIETVPGLEGLPTVLALVRLLHTVGFHMPAKR